MPPEDQDDVQHRRIVVYAILTYVAITTGYLIFTDTDQGLRTALGDKLIDVGGVIAIAYSLGTLGRMAVMAYTGVQANAYTKRSVVSTETVVPGGGGSTSSVAVDQSGQRPEGGS